LYQPVAVAYVPGMRSWIRGWGIPIAVGLPLAALILLLGPWGRLLYLALPAPVVVRVAVVAHPGWRPLGPGAAGPAPCPVAALGPARVPGGGRGPGWLDRPRDRRVSGDRGRGPRRRPAPARGPAPRPRLRGDRPAAVALRSRGLEGGRGRRRARRARARVGP